MAAPRSPESRQELEETEAPTADCAPPEGVLDPAISSGIAGRQRPDSRGTLNARRGRYVRGIERKTDGARIAIAATLRAAARSGRLPFRLTAGDLRFKQFRQKSGLLVIFAVDAKRQHGDEPDQPRERCSHPVDRRSLRASGPDRSTRISRRASRGSPASGQERRAGQAGGRCHACRRRYTARRRIARGTETCDEGEARRPAQTLLVLFTDGSANVSLSGNRDLLWSEVETLCEALRHEGVASVVIDTTLDALSCGRAEFLARSLAGRYARLPRPLPGAAYAIVAEAARTARLERSGK